MKPRKSNVTFSDDAALEYIMALENPHKVGWDSENRIWRTPKKKGYDKNQIAYGLDIRQDHNPVVYNFLKEKGRLKDPWLTEGEATDLMAQLYAAKNSSVNKAVEKMGGNISQRGYNVLRGMAWHGHPMKQLLNPDSITGKAFLRAIANGDRDLNSVFDAYYGYGSNATQFADRIKADARQRGSIIMETLGDGNKRMRFLPVPQWEPQPLPKPIPETQYPLNGSQAPESISSWNGADSPSAVPTIPSIQKLNNKRNADIQGAFSLPLVTVTGNRRTSLLPRIPGLSDIMLAYSPLNQLNRLLAQSLGLDEFLNDLDVTSDLFKFKNGKLPKYEDGVAADATWHENWLTGRQAQLKENMSLHPRYKYSNAWDAEHQILRLKNTPEFSENLPSGNYGLSNGGKIVYDDELIKKYSGDRIDVYPEGVRVHERSHAMLPLPLEDKISRIGGIDRDKNPYIDEPSEIYSGLMEQRYRLKLSPDYKVTPEDIKQWRDNGLLNIYLLNKSDDVLLRYFNEVASNPNPLFDPNAVRYVFGPSDGKMLYAKNGKLPRYKDGTRYIPNDNGGWDRITDDPTADVFADFVVTPKGNRTEKVVNRPGPYDLKLREQLRNAGYVTDEMLEQDARQRYLNQLRGRGELPLQLVSPEFDLLLLGASTPYRTGKALRNIRTLNKEMNAVFDEGLRRGSTDMPWIYDAELVVDPKHVVTLSATKSNPKRIELVIKPITKQENPAVLNDELGYPMEDWLLSDGLHAYPVEDSPNNAINLIKGVGSPHGDYNAAKVGIRQIERPKSPSYTSYDLAPNPPEAEYSGRPSTKIVPRELLGLHSHEILNPEVFSENTKRLLGNKNTYGDETFVDRNGVVNVRNVLNAVLNFYKTHPNAKPYKYITNTNKEGQVTNLRLHINDVVKSAQSIPVPEGYTRLQLVQAALFHDIGKVFDPGKHSHGPIAVDILEQSNIDVDDAVKNAIRHHMSNHMLDKDPLSRALHFADVARGLDWDNAAVRFPHLAYPYKKPQLHIPKISLRDEIKTRINPWLKNHGYNTIKLDVSEEEAWRQLEDRIDQHLSFLRGVRDPLKNIIKNEDDIRNAENSISGVADEFGLGENYAKSPDAAEFRMRYSGSYIPKSPTAPGRRSHLYGDRNVGGLTEYTETDYSKMIGADPKKRDALYVSTSDDVVNQYATANTDKREGAGYIVRLPKRARAAGESMSEHLLKNDFDMIHTDLLHSGLTGGTGAMFEDPYRLLTGRSLISDMKKEGIIKPRFVDKPDIVAHKSDPANISPRVGNRYTLLEHNMDMANAILNDFGIQFKLQPSLRGDIYMPKKLTELANELESLKLAKDNLTPTVFDYRNYDSATRLFLNDAFDEEAWGSIASNDRFVGLSKDLIESEIQRASMLEDELFVRSVVGDDVVDQKAKKNKFRGTFPKKYLDLLAKRGYITLRQVNAAEKAFKFGGTPLKYIDIKRIANKYLDRYLQSVKDGIKHSKTIDIQSLRPSTQQMIDFMRAKGVRPRYEIEGFGENNLFVIDANKSNKLKNSGDIERTYGYVLGELGKKLLDIAEKVLTKTHYNPNHVKKDDGAYSKLKISRKTLRTIGATTAAGGTTAAGSTTLKPRKKKQ